MSMVIGGYVITSGGDRHQLDLVMDPSDRDVQEILTNVAASAGIVELRPQPTPDDGPYKLVLYVEDKVFLLMLNESDRDGEHHLRTLNRVQSEKGLVTLLGEKYPASATTSDIDLVCSVFLEYLRTGNVSKTVMTY